MKRNIADTVNFTLLFAAVCALIICSKQARVGAADGMTLALDTVVPGLLPILIIFSTIMKSSAKRVVVKLLGGFVRAVFNLPEAAAPAIFFGLAGGYPTGALLTRQLFDDGEIDGEQARRMMCFNFCGGCGFIITAVGSAVYDSAKVGAMLFFSSVISELIIGFALSFKGERIEKSRAVIGESLPLADALNCATQSSCTAVINMSGYIILFSAVCSTVKFPSALTPFLEITSGVCKSRFPLCAVCAFLSFGGVCVHMQIFGALRRFKMNYFHFLTFRVLSAFISYGVMRVMLKIFPVTQSVFASAVEGVKMSSVNMTLSFLLIAGCFVSVLDLSGRRRKV